jgi:putative heme-binding domain-containing protein
VYASTAYFSPGAIRSFSEELMRFCLLLTVAVGIVLGQSRPDELKNPVAGQAQAIEAGQKIFQNGCAACHGANAEGGRGPNLNDNGHVRAMTDEQIFNTVRRGVPGTDMPGSKLSDNAVWEVATFVRSLSTPAFSIPVSGNAQAGQTLFFGKAGCGRCHMIGGTGGFIGPDLTNIGASSTLKQLRQSIIDPNARIDDGFRGVTAVLRDGTRVDGVAKNNSSYSIQILDARGRLHLLDKSDLTQIAFSKKSLMPDTYKNTLSPRDLDDVLAFLSRQSVRPNAPVVRHSRVRH